MKKKNIFICGLIAFVMCFSFMCINSLSFKRNVNALDTNEEASYFYNQLPNMAKRFYSAIRFMDENGQLKTGTAEYDLITNNVISTSDINAYIGGDPNILRMFGAGRDAYMLDNADLFYTDFDKLSINIGKKSSGFVATMGTGRSDDYYITNGLNNAETINTEIEKYNSAVSKIVTDANNLNTPEEKISYVNDEIIKATTYGFGYDEHNQRIADVEPYIRTAYGALVKGTSVCEGYARAFKAVLDKLNIPCVLVNGYLLSKNNSYQPHMWNYVEINEEWYGVDVTLNDEDREDGQTNISNYLLLGKNEMRKDHAPDGIISQSNFEFSYPTLTGNYGLKVEGPTYENSTMKLVVSYNNQNSAQIEEKGLYLICRVAADGEKQWDAWYSINRLITNGMGEGHYVNNENSTLINTYAGTMYIQLAVANIAPNSTNSLTSDYAYDEVPAQNILDITEEFYNEKTNALTRAPFVKSVSPSNATSLDVEKTYNIEIEYDEPLKLQNGETTPKINVTSDRDENISDNVVLENVKWSETKPNKVSFTFTASQLYEHNYMTYYFTPTNLIKKNAQNDAVIYPRATGYIFERSKIVCNKILGDGRLYMNVYGQPSLVDNSDLSMSGWEYNGKTAFDNQRSQLALVVTKPNKTDSDAMIDSVVDSTTGISNKDVLSSETYELSIDLCGCVTQIPNGSYLKLAFGFPKGYSPEDTGVTFKVYHFVRDNDGKIDYSKTTEVECVVTPYGIVAEVDSFSPYAVVALPTNKIQNVKKGIYTRVVGSNGSIKVQEENNSLNTANINFVEKDKTVTYVLESKDGYQVDFVLLNGKERINVEDNEFTLTYDSLNANNTIDVGFVASRIANHEKENKITSLQTSFMQNQKLTYNTPEKSSNTTLIIVIVLICVTIIGGGIALYFYFKKRKSNA